MNNIDEKQNKTITCMYCKKVFILPVNGLFNNGKFICMDCLADTYPQNKLNGAIRCMEFRDQ